MLREWGFCTWIGFSMYSGEKERIGFMSGSSSELRFLYTPAFGAGLRRPLSRDDSACRLEGAGSTEIWRFC